MIYVVGFRDRVPTENRVLINTTSRSPNWTSGLSPFNLPAGKLYGDYEAHNVENAWQGAKVFAEFVDENGMVKDEYFKWAQKLWRRKRAERYPMGKGVKPKFHYWDGKKYDYVTARKEIYIPLYARAVEQCEEFKAVVEIAEACNNENMDMYLLDFDGFNHIEEGIAYEEILDNPNRSLGHAFIIWNLLKEKYGLIK